MHRPREVSWERHVLVLLVVFYKEAGELMIAIKEFEYNGGHEMPCSEEY